MNRSASINQDANSENQKISALQKAIEEGIKSGIAKNFNPEKNLEKLKSKRK